MCERKTRRLFSASLQAQMVRRVKAYLKNMKVITDEDKLHAMSLECEPPVGGSSAGLSAASAIQIPPPSVRTFGNLFKTILQRPFVSLFFSYENVIRALHPQPLAVPHQRYQITEETKINPNLVSIFQEGASGLIVANVSSTLFFRSSKPSSSQKTFGLK